MTELELLQGQDALHDILQKELKQLDLSGLERFFPQGNGAELVPGAESAADLLQRILQGEALFQWESLSALVKDLFLQELHSSLYLCGEILAICIVSGLLRNLSGTFGKETASRMGNLVCSCTVIALCLAGFREAYSLTAASITALCSLMETLLPIAVPLLLSMGQVTTGGLLTPLTTGAVTLFAVCAEKVILPLFLLSAVFFLGNSLMSRNTVKGLARLLRSAGIFVTGLAVTVFTGFSALQNLAAGNADSLLLQTAKYVTSGSVPIVGGFAADSMELVLQCAGVLKNGLGILGMVLIAGLLVMPLLKLAVLSLVYKGTAALAEPLGEPSVTEALKEMGTSIMLLGVTLFLGALMFFLFLSILVSAGSAL